MEYLRLLSMFDPIHTLVALESPETTQINQSGFDFKRLVMQSISQSLNEKALMVSLTYLGVSDGKSQEPPDFKSSLPDGWVVRYFDLFGAPQILHGLKGSSFPLSRANKLIAAARISENMLRFWLTWAVARTLINMRLKTFLGEPVATLGSLETALDRFLKSLGDVKLDVTERSTVFARATSFLGLIFALESQILLCSGGSFSSFPIPPSICILFFNVNLPVCTDWLRKIRGRALALAQLVEDYGSCVRYSLDIFTSPDLKKDARKRGHSKSLEVLLTASQALLKLGAGDALVGLSRVWSQKQNSKPNGREDANNVARFIMACSFLAEGRLETCQHLLKLVYENLADSDELFKRNVLHILQSTCTKSGEWESIVHEMSLDAESCLDALSTWTLPSATKGASGNVAQNYLSTQLVSICKKAIKDSADNESLEIDVTCSLLEAPILASSDHPTAVLYLFTWLQAARHIPVWLRDMETGIYSRPLRSGRHLGQCLQIIGSNDSLKTLDGLFYPLLGDLACSLGNVRIARKSIPLASQRPQKNVMEWMKKTSSYANLLFAEGRHSEAFRLALAVVACQSDSHSGATLRAECCHKLFDWGHASNRLLYREFQREIAILLDCDAKTISSADISHTLLVHATRMVPNYPRCWLRLFEFAYTNAMTLIDDAASGRPSSISPLLNKLSHLAQDENVYERIRSALLLCFSDTQEDFEFEDLLAKLPLPHESRKEIADCICVIQETILDVFRTCVSSAFKYLSLVSGNQSHGNPTLVMLRLLRVFSKVGGGLRNAYHDYFQSAPSEMWTAVIPQLFARCHHPSSIVRTEISLLITKLCSSTPHLGIYPSLVADISTKRESNSKDALFDVLNMFRGKQPEMVTQVSFFITEIQRIAVLWDEMWIYCLEHIQLDISAKLDRLDAELKRLQADLTVSQDEKHEFLRFKFKAHLAPIIAVLTRVLEKTLNRTPETPYEKIFVERYRDRIITAMNTLQNPENVGSVKDLWKPFAALQIAMHDDCHSRRSLCLSDISPKLASISNSLIPIPGAPSTKAELVVSIDETILVMPTKTRPKQIAINVSSGRKVRFLLKGHEDLCLDQVVEQFLGLVNELLRSDKDAALRGLSARTYAVVPLGTCGMIQWVDNAPGLFSIYRKWSQWAATAKELRKKHTRESASTEPIMFVRPNELFMEKINQAMRGGLLARDTPRNEWPAELLEQIFRELQKETPNDVFSRELQMGATSSMHWWNRTVSFARSISVMSMLGYIIGLGDRHLDNILWDMKTCDVIHIDFNICFERGNRLRIPETVPFRLTQNIMQCLGPTGIEGEFRAGCEHTMRVLQSNADSALTVLDALVYNPISEWTREGGAERSAGNTNKGTGVRHAIKVIKRVQCKLGCQDSQVDMRSVSEQVESVIKQAIDPKRLSKMYEGWMSWI